jgi:hypothetical protein
MHRILAAATAIAIASAQAHGACRDDISAVRDSIYRYHHIDQGRFSAALHWLNLAVEYEPADEVSCLNYLAKARKVLTAQLPPPDCNVKDGPLPPECPTIGFASPDAPFVFLPSSSIGGVGGGGGGGGTIALPPGSGVPPSAPGAARSD